MYTSEWQSFFPLLWHWGISGCLQTGQKMGSGTPPGPIVREGVGLCESRSASRMEWLSCHCFPSFSLQLKLESEQWAGGGEAHHTRAAARHPVTSAQGGGVTGRINVLSGTPNINLYGLRLISSGERLVAVRSHTSTHKLTLTLAHTHIHTHKHTFTHLHIRLAAACPKRV